MSARDDARRQDDSLVRAFVNGIRDRRRNPYRHAVFLDHYMGARARAWWRGYELAGGCGKDD